MITKKLQKLLSIYSIPLEENWQEFSDKDKYTVYKYWRVLGILDQTQHNSVFEKRILEINPIMIEYFKSLNYHFNPKNYVNENIADVGSGFGFITFWLILNGANVVYSIGDPKRIGFIDRLYKRAVEKNLIDDEKLVLKPELIKVEDRTLANAIVPNSLNMVLLNDTLEHITPRIFPSLVKSCFNDLKPGGVFISKQQNTDSPRLLKKLRKVWDQGEREQFIKQRYEIIRTELSEINQSDAKELAKKTRGLDSIDFYKAIEKFNEHKEYPNHDLDVPPIDVKTDVPHEGNTSIKRICSVFEANGFQEIHVYADLLSSRRSKYFQPLARSFPKAFFSTHFFDETSVFFIRK